MLQVYVVVLPSLVESILVEEVVGKLRVVSVAVRFEQRRSFKNRVMLVMLQKVCCLDEPAYE